MSQKKTLPIDPSLRDQMVDRVIKLYPSLESQLHYHNAFELLVAVSLSAQCTDAMVNRVTPELFRFYPTPQALAEAPLDHLEKLVFRTGFYKNKARNLLLAGRVLCENFGGQVPQSMKELITIPGVGRKSANVIRGHMEGLPAIIVDTHFKRVVRRLGLTQQESPEKIEADLLSLIPAPLQFPFSMAVNNHGRQICGARKPLCPQCPLSDLCPQRGVSHVELKASRGRESAWPQKTDP